MAAAVMDEYMDGDAAMDNDEVFPCKGCGEVSPPLVSSLCLAPVRLVQSLAFVLLLKALC